MKFSKKRIIETVDKAEEGDILSKRFDIFIMTLIVLNVAAVVMETVSHIYTRYQFFFDTFEVVSVTIFSVEYVLRLWACTSIPRYSHWLWGRTKYFFSMAAIIDLLAILPFFLPLIFVIDGRVLRLLRVFRLFRLFKLGRYSRAFMMITAVIRRRREELVVTLSFVFVMLVLSSSMMYYIEHEAQPDVFTSIPATMWWGVATLTTVGYGDVYPVTPFGKLLGAFIAVLGVGIFALPAGIIATGFESELRRKNEEEDDG